MEEINLNIILSGFSNFDSAITFDSLTEGSGGSEISESTQINSSNCHGGVCPRTTDACRERFDNY